MVYVPQGHGLYGYHIIKSFLKCSSLSLFKENFPEVSEKPL